MTGREQTFSPDWASPPGDTIIDLMEEKDWTKGRVGKTSRLQYRIPEAASQGQHFDNTR